MKPITMTDPTTGKKTIYCSKCHGKTGRNHDGGVICQPCGVVYAGTITEAIELFR